MTDLEREELLRLGVALLADMPLRTTLVLSVDRRPVLWTTARRRALEAAAHAQVVFSPLEYEAAAYGAQEGRAGPRELRSWVERKARTPTWRLEARVAVDEALGLLVSEGVIGAAAVRAAGFRVRAGRGAVARMRWDDAERAVERWSIPRGALSISLGGALRTLGAELVGVTLERDESA